MIIKVLSFLVVGICSCTLYAKDISTHDIKGIKLGMSKDEVLKNMSCASPKIENQHINTVEGQKVLYKEIRCSDKSGSFIGH